MMLCSMIMNENVDDEIGYMHYESSLVVVVAIVVVVVVVAIDDVR